MMKLLVTGPTGKVGTALMQHVLTQDRFADCEVVALCHNRTLPPQDRVTVRRGSLADAKTVKAALEGVTHVVHLAAVKESPDLAIDVAVKGMFLLLEEFRISPTARQFILISGDCAVGHIFHAYPGPVTEDAPRRAYPGCYALTKVIEEVMLEQYHIQYGLNGCCLRAPWIMEKDDFRYALRFGPDQFGGPLWSDLLSGPEVARFARSNDDSGQALRRNFVHVTDLVSAILAALDAPAAEGQLFNITMDAPVDYGAVADYLQATRGTSTIEIPTPYYSNWLDNSKARLRLDWRPEVNLEGMIERAWAYARPANEPRKVWYPG
jgi:UDP-glucose 4-epimerase